MPLDVPRMLVCCAAFGHVDGAQETNLTLYVSSYYYRCVLILLYMCRHTADGFSCVVLL